MYRIVVLLCCALIAGSGSAVAQPSPLSLDDAVRLALENNPALQASRFDAEAADAGYRRVRSALLPRVQIQASYTRLSDNVPPVEIEVPGFEEPIPLLPNELDRYYSEISVEQPIFAGTQLYRESRAVRHEAAAADLLADQGAAQLAFDVRTTYAGLQQALALEAVAETALAHIDAHVEIIRQQVEEGERLATDLMSARTRQSEIRLELLEAQNQVRLLRLDLVRLTGLPVESLLEIAPIEYSITEDLPLTPGRNLQVAALTEQVRAMEHRLAATHGAWFPQISAIGRYIYARPNQYFFLEPDRFRPSWEVGVALRWSLFEGGGRLADTYHARAQLAAAEARLTDAEQTLEVETERFRLNTDHARQAVAVAEQGVADAEETLRVAGLQFEEGLLLSSDILEAELAWRSAQARLAQAHADYLIAHAALLHALGRIW